MVILGLIAGICAIIYVLWRRRRIGVLEALFLWMSLSTLLQDAVAIEVMNLGWIRMERSLPEFWAYALNRVFLVPLLGVAVTAYFFSKQSAAGKAAVVLIGILLLSFVEWGTERLGLIEHVHWEAWFTFLQSTIFIITALLLRMMFLRLQRKGG
jgi:hypothetical protein